MQLPPDRQAELKTLSRRSNARGLLRLAGHLLLLAGTTALLWASRGSLWFGPALLAQGIVIVFLFCAAHEAIHRTAFKTRALNDAVAWACGLAILLPPTAFRAFHLAHHRYTQDPAQDPELAEPRPQSLGGYLWCLSGLPYWRGQLAALLRHAAGRVKEPYITRRERAKVRAEARLVLVIYVLAAAVSFGSGSDVLLIYWWLPALLGQPFLRAYLLAEHHGCPDGDDMMHNSRTTESNAALRWLAWNMPYHGAHHAYPAVPFFALPAAQRVLAEQPQTRCPGYLAFHRDVVRGFLARRTSRA